EVPEEFKTEIVHHKTVFHTLTHKNLTVQIYKVILNSEKIFKNFAAENSFIITNLEDSQQKSFPKPLENYLKSTEIEN
ncbi:MAG: A/G-specific adenine glycosylase, partial [Kaistella sp.]